MSPPPASSNPGTNPPTTGESTGPPLATWVQITNDGDYLYNTEHTEAKPASVNDLTTRINQLIATDATALRNSPHRLRNRQ